MSRSCDREPHAGAHHRSCEDQTDTIDASVLAQLYAAAFCAKSWIRTSSAERFSPASDPAQPDRPWLGQRRTSSSRSHSHLIPSCPHADLCGASGRAWLFHQVLPEDNGLPSNATCTPSSIGSMRTSRSSSAILPFSVRRRGRQTPDDNPGGRHGGGARHRGRDRRRGTLRAVAEAGELPWPQPECAPIGSWARVSRPDHEAGPWACARHARRGGLGGSASAGSVAGVLPASPRPPLVSMSPLSRPPVSSRCSSGIC